MNGDQKLFVNARNDIDGIIVALVEELEFDYKAAAENEDNDTD